MAVYTHLSDEDIQEFLSRYGSYELVSAQGISKGVENSNYLLRVRHADDLQKCILTIFEQRVQSDDLPFFLSLMRHLAMQELQCPQPLETCSGTMILAMQEKPAALFTFLSGQEVNIIKPEHLEQVGLLLAGLHKAGKSFKGQRVNTLSPNRLVELYQTISNRLDRLQASLQSDIARDLQAYVDWESLPLPRGVIHADLFRDNVLFERDQISGVLDFYFACNDYFAYDLVIAMNDWCFEADGAFNADNAAALLNTYDSQRALTPKEWEYLPLLARAAALRFLLTRAYDMFFQSEGAMVTVKDPMEYLQKWQFHRQVKSYREYLSL